MTASAKAALEAFPLARIVSEPGSTRIDIAQRLTRVSRLVDGGDGQAARQYDPHRLRQLRSQRPFRYPPGTGADRRRWRGRQSSRGRRGRIGGIADGDCAAVREPKSSGRAAGHLVNSLRKAEKAQIPGVMSKNPGKRSIEAGVRLTLPCYAVRCDARTIRANRYVRVGQNRPYVVLRLARRRQCNPAPPHPLPPSHCGLTNITRRRNLERLRSYGQIEK